jgi:hypothetical protein
VTAGRGAGLGAAGGAVIGLLGAVLLQQLGLLDLGPAGPGGLALALFVVVGAAVFGAAGAAIGARGARAGLRGPEGPSDRTSDVGAAESEPAEGTPVDPADRA